MRKSLLFTLLALALILTCGGTANAGPLFDAILKKGELVVGTTGTQPPFSIVNKDGELIGLDIDLARAIAGNMKLKVRFVRMPFAELLPALQAGKVDLVVSGVTITPERNTRVAFAGPYYVSGKGMLTKLKNVEALKKEGAKLKVATLKSSTSQEIVEKIAPKATTSVVPVSSYEEALELLTNDKVEILIADLPFCAYTAERNPEKTLVVGETKLSFEPLGIALPEDPLLINAVDNFLRMLIISGDMDVLQVKWLKSREWFKQLP